MEDSLVIDEKTLLSQFKLEVFDKAKIIDPEDEEDWFSMAFGYFLANGIEIPRAYELANPAARGSLKVPKSHG